MAVQQLRSLFAARESRFSRNCWCISSVENQKAWLAGWRPPPCPIPSFLPCPAWMFLHFSPFARMSLCGPARARSACAPGAAAERGSDRTERPPPGPRLCRLFSRVIQSAVGERFPRPPVRPLVARAVSSRRLPRISPFLPRRPLLHLEPPSSPSIPIPFCIQS